MTPTIVEPAVAEQAGEHQDHGDGVADGNGPAGGRGSVESAGKKSPQDAPAIERVSGHEIEYCQVEDWPTPGCEVAWRPGERGHFQSSTPRPEAVITAVARQARARLTAVQSEQDQISHFQQ